MNIAEIISTVYNTINVYLVFPSIVLLGIYLTIKLRFIQLSKLKMSFACLISREEKVEGTLTQYQAISAVLAGNFGAGNIPGMAIAITTGGPGALVWMWVMAFFGAVIQYSSCLLGGKFSKVNADKERVGGPMYYLSDGLGFKSLAFLFSFFTVLGAVTVGNITQVNSILLPLTQVGIPPFITITLMALLTGFVILGGVQRFAKVVSSLVPLMALLYLGATFLVLGLHADKIYPSLKLMFSYAFDYSALIGGTLGIGTVKAITAGFDRGIFATDAGTGFVPILQSSAKSRNPVINGLVTLIAPFLVMFVCTGTGLVLIITNAWTDSGFESTNMVTWAFDKGLNSSLGAYIVMLALSMFAFTTILAWANCAEKAISYLWGLKTIKSFRYFYIAIIPLACFIPVDLIWILSDISISFMLLTNLIGIACLSKHVIKETEEFFSTQEPEIPVEVQA